ncbi:uncharacterized protein LOC128200928 [Galleria mellonella]|uniref:Uncharacterized protein LOC128200928 n=1 Tax=Galleria mellonella TaxID=7137 RepID=A0ABM3MKF3_GALME|nr:uncharacterized protein LOC128200928 [Galleria mellonella]
MANKFVDEIDIASESDLEKKIKLYEAQRARSFSRVQAIYDLIPDIYKNETIKKQFLSKVRTLEQLRSEFKEIVEQINWMNIELNKYFEPSFSSLDSFDDLYCEINLVYDQLSASSQSSQAQPLNEKAVTVTSNSNDYMKIPRIELPFYNGDIQQFPFFYESFKRMIHDNNNLTDSDKVHYLFNQLTGKARSIIVGVVPSAENYLTVWETLKLKYYDKRELGTSYLNQLLSMKPLVGASAQNLEDFIDKFAATIAALNQLKLENVTEFIFVHLGLKLLDPDTARSFEMSIRNNNGMPGYEEFVHFVREHVKVLYRTSQPRPSIKNERFVSKSTNSNRLRTNHAHVSTGDPRSKCLFCNSAVHVKISNCDKFLKLNPIERYQYVKDKKLCTNCLSSQHWSSRCTSQHVCSKCDGKHHTILHFNNKPPSQATVALSNTEPCINNKVNNGVQFESEGDHQVLNNQVSEATLSLNIPSLCTMSTEKRVVSPTTEVLGTAKVVAACRNGKEILIRALLDPGSQKNYISAKGARRLGLSVNKSLSASVKGIGGSTQVVKGSVNFVFRSTLQHGKKYSIEALVLENITSRLPTCPIDITKISGFEIVNAPGQPSAIETTLGYIVLGDAPITTVCTSSLSFCATYEVNNLIKKFWEIEDLGNSPILSLEDKQAEDIFKSTVKRTSYGQYEVALPFKLDSENLGNSLKAAERSYLRLESKLRSQPAVKLAYDEVITDHLKKGYLSEVDIVPQEKAYYIPHRAVIREDKITTKLRVVLNASFPTDSGLSLNDILHAGPSLHADLFSILLNLRLFLVAISADVRQMYLAIHVREKDRPFQRILYRFDSNGPIKVYQYNRVAFGLRSSPFLALRTIQQLLEDEGDRFPVAKEIVSRDIFMDDIVSSIINEQKANDAVRELNELFMAGGFELAKWSSNSDRILQEIPEDRHLSQSVSFDSDDDDNTFKILGLRWDPIDDNFTFQVNHDERPCTKRHILSYIARLFDVLGLVAPIVLFAKLLIKDLWIAKIDWDDSPPENIVKKWHQFQRELPLIEQLKFPRHIGVTENCRLTILGFADASERAYGGVVYACVTTPNNDNIITLVCAKSKVSPLKIVSLARLELCAALVLAQLIKKVVFNYMPRFSVHTILAFSDSTVALSWIHSEPYRWQTFVGNRVAKIHENLPSKHFYHIRGLDNPSDCLSRGLTPAQLVSHPLWLHGPPWASKPKDLWPIKPFIPQGESIPEAKSVVLISTCDSKSNVLFELSRKFSSWSKYLRSVVYLLKFARILPKGPISAEDLSKAEIHIIRALQSVYFTQELADLSAANLCSNLVRQLKPFLDNGVIRVGGRLDNADVSYEFRHPFLLPRRDHIVDILIDYHHRKNCHAGPETLMSLLCCNYWIISARRIIRQRIRQCYFCFRLKPQALFPMMADLPSCRVNQVEKPFIHTGCDYAGPISYTPQRRRGVKAQKAYICIFTCMTTRAVHIELATELSTASFLSAFKRFLSRRGPTSILKSVENQPEHSNYNDIPIIHKCPNT